MNGTGLYPTPTRRHRLRRVEHGEVYTEAGQAWDCGTGLKVTAAMAELEQAGWVTRVPGGLPGRESYTLTTAGRAALDGEQ